jgi:5'-nucleotidase
MLKFIRFLLILNLTFTLTFSFSLSLFAQEDLHISILHTNDLHSSFPKNYARLAFLIHSIREQNFKEGRETLVLDSGDFSSGSVYQVLTPNPKYPQSPELEFFKYAGYDAIGFGNHDFDFGLAGFLNMLNKNQNFNVPFISSNIHFKRTSKLFEQIHPYRVINKKNIRIGIMAFLGPNAAKLSLNTRAGISFDGYHDLRGKEDLSETIKMAKETADILKNKEKADIIIMLLHAGKPEDHKIAKALESKSVDIIIAGHTHELYPIPEKENDIIIAQTSGEGRELGVLKFTYHTKTKKLDLDDPKQMGHIEINENIKEDPHYLRLLHV